MLGSLATDLGGNSDVRRDHSRRVVVRRHRRRAAHPHPGHSRRRGGHRGAGPLDETGCPEVIDAAGKWIVPGFIDVHTHYDAEVLLDPGLRESVRHGVTTVLLGNCSLSTVYADSEDAADLFSRVEAVPRKYVFGALEAANRQDIGRRAAEYIEAIDALPLGPNVELAAWSFGPADRGARTRSRHRRLRPAHRRRTGEDGGAARRGARSRDARACPGWTRPSTSSTVSASGRVRCRPRSRRGASGAG